MIMYLKAHLEFSQTSFHVLAVNYFRKKAPSKVWLGSS